MTRSGLNAPPPLPPDRPGPVAAARPGMAPSPAAFHQRAFLVHLAWWLVAIVLYLVTIFFVVPRVEEVDKDFRLDLPAPTRMLLASARSPAAAALPILLMLGASAADAIAAGYRYRRSTPGGRRAYRLAVLFVAAAITLFVVLALFLPYVALIESVSGRK